MIKYCSKCGKKSGVLVNAQIMLGDNIEEHILCPVCTSLLEDEWFE